MNERMDFVLNGANIDLISEKINHFLESQHMEKRNRLSICLSMEEVLLKWQSRFGEEAQCTLQFSVPGRLLGRPGISLELKGDAYDPLEDPDADAEFGDWSRRMLSGAGFVPIYSYEKGKNIVTLKLRHPKRSPLVSLGISIALALVIGLLGSLLLPESAISLMMDRLITPVYDTFLGVLQAIAGPMVFLAVTWGIYSIGDISVLGRIGKRMLGRFIAFSSLMLGFASILCLLAFRLRFAVGSMDSSQLWSILYLLLGIFPDNIISPLLDGNSMQIILCAVLVGGALLILGKKTEGVASLIEQINLIVQFLVEMVSSLIPFFIFIVLVQMIWSGSLGVVLQAWKPLAVFVCVVLLLFTAHFIFLGRKYRVSPLLPVKKCLNTFIVALATASSTASFGTVQHCLDHRMGVDKGITSFGLPLGIVFYAPFTSIYFLISCFYAAEAYDVEISIAWLLIGILITLILAIASPPIPGGTLSCYTVMFTQLGIPLEALAVVLALDVVFDFLATGCNMVELEIQLTDIAGRMNRLDKAMLRSEK